LNFELIFLAKCILLIKKRTKFLLSQKRIKIIAIFIQFIFPDFIIPNNISTFETQKIIK